MKRLEVDLHRTWGCSTRLLHWQCGAEGSGVSLQAVQGDTPRYQEQQREDVRVTHCMVGIQPAPQDGLSDEQLERRANRLWNIEVKDESSEEMGPPERDPEFQALNGNKNCRSNTSC